MLEIAAQLTHYGPIGVVAVIFIMAWMRKDREVARANDRLIDSILEQKNEMLDVIQKYDKTLADVEKVLDKFIED